MFHQNYGLGVCKHELKTHNVRGVRQHMKFIWRSEECTAGAVYLSRNLWLDKELLEKLCYLAFLIYWFAVRRNRCLTDSCGFIFNWAWGLLKFGCMPLNIFKHTSAAGCLHATSLTSQKAGYVPPSFLSLYASRSTDAKCPEEPCKMARLRPFVPGHLCALHVIVVPSSPAGGGWAVAMGWTL